MNKERCNLNRAYHEMINRSGNSASGNSNQKLSLQGRYGYPQCRVPPVPWECVHLSWWPKAAFTGSKAHGVWFILFQSRYPHWPDKPQVRSGHFYPLSHERSLGWAVQLQVAPSHRSREIQGTSPIFSVFLKENWLEPKQINKSWNRAILPIHTWWLWSVWFTPEPWSWNSKTEEVLYWVHRNLLHCLHVLTWLCPGLGQFSLIFLCEVFPKANSIWTLKELALVYAFQFVESKLSEFKAWLCSPCSSPQGACKVGGFKDNFRRQHEDKSTLLAVLFTPCGEGITRAGE